MSRWIAALPMYDWPERRDAVDAQWAAVRERLLDAGVDAPNQLTRVHEDLLDFWKRPDLLFAQTCWGPMELGLADHAQVIGQPSYDGVNGGEGPLYSSAIVMRRRTISGSGDLSEARGGTGAKAPTPPLPLDLFRGARLAYNSPDSMSGIIGLTRDLQAVGESLDIFSERIETGGHRKSIRAIAEGEADVAAIDCLSWALAERYEPAAGEVEVVGWTTKRLGLPFITAKTTPPDVVAALRAAVAGS